MQPKKDPYGHQAEKVISLFCILAFTGRKHSLSHLSRILVCSKQTVQRFVEEIERTKQVQIKTWIENKQRWYHVPKMAQRPNFSLAIDDIQQLLLCRDIVLQTLPETIRENITHTIQKSAVLLPDYDAREMALSPVAHAQPKGRVDYSEAHDILRTILRAIQESCICEVKYRSPEWNSARTFAVAPYRLISFREAFYLRCREEKDLAAKDSSRDRTFAVHRIRDIRPTERKFPAIPDTGESDDFFGLAREEPFHVVVDIVPKAAMYIRERIWSKDQVITPTKDGGLTLEFTATSKPEVLAWILSFGGEAILREPKEMRKEILDRLTLMMERHRSPCPQETP